MEIIFVSTWTTSASVASGEACRLRAQLSAAAQSWLPVTDGNKKLIERRRKLARRPRRRRQMAEALAARIAQAELTIASRGDTRQRMVL